MGRGLQTDGVAKHRVWQEGEGMWSDLTEAWVFERNYLLSTYCVHAVFLIYKPYKIGIVIPLTNKKIFLSEKSNNLPRVI